MYDYAEFPLQTGGNVYYRGAYPYAKETQYVAQAEFDPKVHVVTKGDDVYLNLTLNLAIEKARTAIIATEVLGKAKIPHLPYVQPDGTPIRISTDYFGKSRNGANPTPGPFEKPGRGELMLKVW